MFIWLLCICFLLVNALVNVTWVPLFFIYFLYYHFPLKWHANFITAIQLLELLYFIFKHLLAPPPLLFLLLLLVDYRLVFINTKGSCAKSVIKIKDFACLVGSYLCDWLLFYLLFYLDAIKFCCCFWWSVTWWLRSIECCHPLLQSLFHQSTLKVWRCRLKSSSSCNDKKWNGVSAGVSVMCIIMLEMRKMMMENGKLHTISRYNDRTLWHTWYEQPDQWPAGSCVTSKYYYITPPHSPFTVLIL